MDGWVASAHRRCLRAAPPYVDEALTARINRKNRDVDANINLGLPGATATATSKSKERPELSTFRTIQQLARKASEKRRTILFWIDEAQRSTASEVATPGPMQEIANAQGRSLIEAGHLERQRRRTDWPIERLCALSSDPQRPWRSHGRGVVGIRYSECRSWGKPWRFAAVVRAGQNRKDDPRSATPHLARLRVARGRVLP